MAEKSKVLVIGGTGYIGKFIVEASAKSGHPTFALVREPALSNPAKAQLVEGFKSLGVKFVHGDVYDQESLLNALKQVDVVISAVGTEQLEGQDKIVAAIKAARNIKSFALVKWDGFPEEQVLKNIQEAAFPLDLMLAISHSVFVKGDQTAVEIEPSFGVEATELYPDVKYSTMDQYLDQIV